MTRDEILAMPAGRELDALIAEKVMGWTRVPVPVDANGQNAGECIVSHALKELLAAGQWDWPKVGEVALWYFCEPWSTKIAAAWDVVEGFKRRELMLRWVAGEPPCYTCVFGDNAYGNAETAPLAICRAALLAVLND